MFNLLDSFFRRSRHASQLGQEIHGHRDSYPPNWQRFLTAVDEVSVPAYVERVADPGLTDLLREALDLYAGSDGFLGRHRRKVFGYLETAFKVGRSVTSAASPAHPRTGSRSGSTPSWSGPGSNAHRSLHPGPEIGTHAASRPPTATASQTWCCMNDEEHGYWVSVDGALYDVTSLLPRHPGGPTRTRLRGTGRHGDVPPAAWLERRRATATPELPNRQPAPIMPPTSATIDGSGARPALQVADTWARVLDLVVETQNALRHDYSLRRAVGPGHEPEVPRSPYLLSGLSRLMSASSTTICSR